MKIEIKNRWSGAIQWEGEIGVEFDTAGLGLRLGAAIKLAISSGADLCGADLCGAVLSDTVLRGAVLRGADLCGAVLSDTDLCGADLSGADLCGADLSDTVLRGAVLRGAVLSGADLSGADLSGADLCGADLSGAVLRGAKILHIGSVRHGLYFQHPDLITVGCERHTIAEWREKVDEIGAANGYTPIEIEVYKLHIEHLARVAQLLWPAETEKSSEVAAAQ